jgi:iturin family lipopeptide synthetase A
LIREFAEAAENDMIAMAVTRQFRNPAKDHVFLLEQLGNCWKYGAVINWEKVYEGRSAGRIPLPLYPFNRDPYPLKWDLRQIWQEIRTGGVASKNVSDWFYKPGWKPAPFAENVPDSTGLRGRQLIIFNNGNSESDGLIRFLQEEGATCFAVTGGDAFRKESDSAYTINFHRQPDFDEVFRDILLRSGDIGDIITCCTPEDAGVDHASIHETIHSSYLVLAFIAQSLGRLDHQEPGHIYVLARQAAKVKESDFVNPLIAAVLGAVKVIPLEYELLKCTLIDIGDEQAGTGTSYQLLKKQMAEGKGMPVVAFREGQRWLPVIEKALLPAQLKKLPIGPGAGCYVVTGGFGGMGFSIAAAMAGDKQANVALIVRSAFPERRDWEQWLLDHDGGMKIQKE